jgi:hypothetical protein
MNQGGGINWTAVGVALSLIMSALTSAFVFGEMRGDIRHNKEDITQLQADGRTINAALSKIETSTARIEAKLEILLPTSMDQDRHRDREPN